jgi:hypothetical protein
MNFFEKIFAISDRKYRRGLIKSILFALVCALIAAYTLFVSTLG